MVDFAPRAAVQTDAAARPSARRYYVLALLTAVYALNFLDRTIFNVLIEPIKKEFALSDTTMGLLAGFGSLKGCLPRRCPTALPATARSGVPRATTREASCSSRAALFESQQVEYGRL